MAIVFPVNPSVNDTFTVGSITYKWDSTKWIGLGVTPIDRLIEGSNSLEINASNNLIWTGNNVGIGTDTPDYNLSIGDGSSYVIQNLRAKNDEFCEFRFGDPEGVAQGKITYDNGTNSLRFTTNGDGEKLRITSDGKVGINEDQPVGRVDIVGFNTSTFGIAADGALNLSAPNGSLVGRKINLNFTVVPSATNAVGTIAFEYTNQSNFGKGDLIFGTRNVNTDTAPTERLRIDSDGNVSITNNPTTNASKLFIRANSGTNAGKWSDSCIALYNTTGASEYSQMGLGYTLGTWAPSYMGYINTSTSSFGMGALVFGTRDVVTDSQPTERFRIQPSGFVGINEDSPGAQLTVKRASTSSTGLLGGLKLKQGSATNGNRISLLFSSLDDFDVAAVNGVIETHSGSASNNEGRLEFWTKHGGSDIAVRGRFDSEGSFYNFSVNHGIYTETSIGAGTVKYLYRGSNSNGSNIVFNVWSNGNVESATNSFGPVSDVKLKENIVDANSQWEDFKAVQFRKFNFKEESGYETHTQLGVIAQELEAISPGLVYETPDLDRDGNETGTTTKKVKASVLTMKALVALQEAMEKIEVLEKRLSDAGI